MPIPVITVAQMREWEQATWAAGQTETEVIRRVGKVLAQRARQLTKPGSLILILAGKGHNGDDARAASEHLSDRQVELLDVASPQTDLPKLTAALAQRPKLVVDALFGIGLNRPLDGPWIKFITCINQARLPVLCVDVPSGLNAETGETFGAAIEASVTFTVGAQIFPRVVQPEIRDEIVKAGKESGFQFITLDLAGYRTGSLNELLNGKSLKLV